MKTLSILLIVFSFFECLAQKQDRIWLFADSAGIDFNDPANPVAIYSNLTRSNGALIQPAASFSSIADNSGQLLFYSAGIETNFDRGGRVFNKYMQVMPHGDSIFAYPWIGQGCLIVPYADSQTKFFLFTLNRQGNGYTYSYYSVIDMSLDSGRGDVTIKNIPLVVDEVNEKMTAVKHANGRDWWVILQATNTDEFIKFLITPNSLSAPIRQAIGSIYNPAKFFGQMFFSKDGDKLGLVGSGGYVDIFDFDRCSGDLFNYRNAGEQVFSQQNRYVGCSFSPNGNVFYASPNWYEYKNIYQYDLTASNILATKQTVFNYPDTGIFQYLQMGQHLLGPDGNIYVAKGNGYGGINSNTYYTHHIDAITNPNQLGPGCNYQPAFFDLGTGRTIHGLPNMVNYSLGQVSGSICDSLHLDISRVNADKYFTLFPNPVKDHLTIEIKAQGTFHVQITDILGNNQFEKTINTGSHVLDVAAISQGVYKITFKGEGVALSRKVIILN